MHSNSWIYPKYSISKSLGTKLQNKPSQGVKNVHAGPTFAHISTQIREWIRNRFLHTNLPPQSRRSGISRALQLQTAGFLPEGVWVSVWESVCVCVCVCVWDGQRLLLSAQEWKGIQSDGGRAERVSVCETGSMFVGFVSVFVCMWERVGSVEQGRDTTVKLGP